ncbi:unnamed protein product [Onchocerca flexuosa]|uniref:Uncharacterized protein n=1 Tax=Onchocerca flexuosa TaxID=387005 RepID=A0A183HZG7_9BILA|nr:unnamed protein product [Onchocerca flexuosa]
MTITQTTDAPTPSSIDDGRETRGDSQSGGAIVDDIANKTCMCINGRNNTLKRWYQMYRKEMEAVVSWRNGSNVTMNRSNAYHVLYIYTDIGIIF